MFWAFQFHVLFEDLRGGESLRLDGADLAAGPALLWILLVGLVYFAVFVCVFVAPVCKLYGCSLGIQSAQQRNNWGLENPRHRYGFRTVLVKCPCG